MSHDACKLNSETHETISFLFFTFYRKTTVHHPPFLSQPSLLEQKRLLSVRSWILGRTSHSLILSFCWGGQGAQCSKAEPRVCVSERCESNGYEEHATRLACHLGPTPRLLCASVCAYPITPLFEAP